MTWTTVRSTRPRAVVGRRVRLMAILIGAGALTACASAGGVGSRAAVAAREPTSIVIENNSWDRVTVYISRGDQLWRLGDVSALARTEFPVHRMGFLADGRSTFLAGRSFRSDQFMLISGTVAVWTIENQSGLSHVSVR